MKSRTLGLGLLLLFSSSLVSADPISDLQAGYRAQSADRFSAEAGSMLWDKPFPNPKSGKERSCSSCHTPDLKLPGKHVRTGKSIEPMAPSVNPKRLTDSRKIEKWFKRNCKWTLGRECTPQEKGNLLVYLQTQ